MSANEGSLTFLDSPDASNAGKSVSVSPGGEWGGAVLSDSGTCFLIKADGTGSVTYGSASDSNCTGELAIQAANDANW